MPAAAKSSKTSGKKPTAGKVAVKAPPSLAAVKKPLPPKPVPAESVPVKAEPPKPAIVQERSKMSSPEQPDSSQVLRGGAGNVDKIRDILFGTQMRDYESRFNRLEETLIKETLEIRETNRKKFEQLEGFVRREFETVQSRIKSERDERIEVASQLARELKDLTDGLSRRIRDLDDRGTTTERELRNDLLQQARDLTEEIRARHEELSTILDRRVHELRDGKTDRATLAALFSEVALRLSDQFQIPGSEE